MSYVDTSKLKGTLDPSIVHITVRIPITTAVLTIDTLTQFGSYARAYKITNKDNLQNISFVQHQIGTTAALVPPSSETSDEGWFSFIQLTPDPVSGNGVIELELVERAKAQIG